MLCLFWSDDHACKSSFAFTFTGNTKCLECIYIYYIVGAYWILAGGLMYNTSVIFENITILLWLYQHCMQGWQLWAGPMTCSIGWCIAISLTFSHFKYQSHFRLNNSAATKWILFIDPASCICKNTASSCSTQVISACHVSCFLMLCSFSTNFRPCTEDLLFCILNHLLLN